MVEGKQLIALPDNTKTGHKEAQKNTASAGSALLLISSVPFYGHLFFRCAKR
jgi:hypothetical protein